MDKNCLVTTLKSTVNNDNLKKLGVLGVNLVNTNAYSSTFNPSVNQDFSTIDGEESVLTITSNNAVITVASPNVRISDTKAMLRHNGKLRINNTDTSVNYVSAEITNKYALEKVSFLTMFDTGDLSYLDHLLKLSGVAPFTGRFEDFQKYTPNIEDLSIHSTNAASVGLNGKIANLIGFCTNLKYILIGRTTSASISNIEDIVAIRRALGQTSSPVFDNNEGVRISMDGGSLYFNGASVSGRSKWLTWTSSTITYDGTTIDNDDVAVL